MDYPTRPCELCGTHFKPVRRTSRTCSAICRGQLNTIEQNAKLRTQRPAPICEACGASMPGARSDRRSCSPECKLTLTRLAYVPRNKRRGRATCAGCKKPFDAVRSDARWCSEACYYAHNESARAARIAYVKRWAEQNKTARQVHRSKYRDARRAWEATGTISPRDWKRVVNRHHGLCAYCKDRPYEHMDHVVPLSRGGTNTIGNVLPACADCNLSKHNRFLTEWTTRGGERRWRISTPATETQSGFAGIGRLDRAG